MRIRNRRLPHFIRLERRTDAAEQRRVKEANVYGCDVEAYRYTDQLKWSRFQTIFAIEGGALYTIYKAGLATFENFGLSVIASALVFVLARLVIADEQGCIDVLERIKAYENREPSVPLSPTKPEGAGKRLIRVGFGFIAILNVYLVGSTFATMVGDPKVKQVIAESRDALGLGAQTKDDKQSVLFVENRGIGEPPH